VSDGACCRPTQFSYLHVQPIKVDINRSSLRASFDPGECMLFVQLAGIGPLNFGRSSSLQSLCPTGTKLKISFGDEFSNKLSAVGTLEMRQFHQDYRVVGGKITATHVFRKKISEERVRPTGRHFNSVGNRLCVSCMRLPWHAHQACPPLLTKKYTVTAHPCICSKVVSHRVGMGFMTMHMHFSHKQSCT